MEKKLYDPELGRMVSRDEVSSDIWEELLAVNEFFVSRGY